jgi:hypothetical protein
VRQRLHGLLLAELRGAGLLDFTRAAVDSSHLRAMKGGPATGPSPVDRAKAGSKHHLRSEVKRRREPPSPRRRTRAAEPDRDGPPDSQWV